MIEIIKNLKHRENLDKGYFHVENIPNYQNHLLGIDSNNYIILLIKCKKEDNIINPISSQGEYLDILYQKECKIRNNDLELEDVFTVLQLKSNNQLLINTFLNICEHILNKIGQLPNLDITATTLDSIKKLFSKLLNKTSKTELGLWGELFLIYISKDHEYLIDSWHKNSNNTFDFNDGIDKVEVKTTIQSERKHNFSLHQLSSSVSDEVFICSIMTTEIDLGSSIIQLVEMISDKISMIYRLKLNEKMIEVAGKNIEEFNNKYDISTAKKSLKIYNSNKIPSIQKESIPVEVSNVKFTASLEKIYSLENTDNKKGILSKIN
jgi:hypothetical protein